MEIRGLNHITFSVEDMDRSVKFYAQVVGARLLCRLEHTAYFDLAGIWLALNQGTSTPPTDYTHIAFSIQEDQFDAWRRHLAEQGITLEPHRRRHPGEGKSLYFRDPDGHLLELHTKTRKDRVDYYRLTRTDMEFL